MATLEEQFELAAEHFGNVLVGTASNNQKLRVYALWNQAVKGDVDVSKAPSSMNVVKHAKFTARKKVMGLPKEAAMKRYIQEVRNIDPDWAMSTIDSADSLNSPRRGAGGGQKGKNGGLFRRASRSAKNKLYRASSKEASVDPKVIEREFEQATDFVRRSPIFANRNSRSLLISLYKQATVGPCNVAAPRGFSRERYARWRAWANLFDMPKHVAMQKYVEHVRRFAPDFATDTRSAAEHAEDAAIGDGPGGAGAEDLDGAAALYDGTGPVTADSIAQLMQTAADEGGLVYVMTGASGFIGSFLIGELLARNPNSIIFALTRASSRGKLLAKIDQRFGEEAASRVIPVDANISEPGMGLDKSIAKQLTNGKKKAAGAGVGIDHFFHLAASYDMTKSLEHNERANVAGTMYAVEFANALFDAWGTVFQYASSIVVAGGHNGIWFEENLDEGQEFTNPYARTKFEAEMLVRAKCKGDFRVYRPGIVVGSSLTGEAEKIDGLYYYFKPLQHLRKFLPTSVVLPCIEGNAIPIVPVDFVVQAMDAIAHNDDPGLHGKAFHLVDSSPMTVIEILNTLAKAAGTPSFSARIPLFLQAVVPPKFWSGVADIPILTHAPEFLAKNLFEIPESAAAYMTMNTDYDDTETRAALEGTGVRCPRFDRYAWRLWDYYVRFMDPRLEKPTALRTAVRGKVVMVTGASDGIGKTLATRLAKAGAHVILVARSIDKLEAVRADIEVQGGSADVFTADLAQEGATYAMLDKVVDKYGAVDILVNNAGRSIRRSIEFETRDRFHDFERLMNLNFYGSMRVTLDLLRGMRDRKQGHVINVGSISQQTYIGRFAAYVASKSALTESMKCIASEVAADNVKVSNVYMPLVKTNMVTGPGASKYDHLDLLTPNQAAEMIERAIVTKEPRIESSLGRYVSWGHLLAPSLTTSVLNSLYRMEPEKPPKGKEYSAAADGDTSQLRAIRRLFAGAV